MLSTLVTVFVAADLGCVTASIGNLSFRMTAEWIHGTCLLQILRFARWILFRILKSFWHARPSLLLHYTASLFYSIVKKAQLDFALLLLFYLFFWFQIINSQVLEIFDLVVLVNLTEGWILAHEAYITILVIGLRVKNTLLNNFVLICVLVFGAVRVAIAGNYEWIFLNSLQFDSIALPVGLNLLRALSLDLFDFW